ncbi:UNVERIFIED_CONTAM: hypothetical protein FKN15_026678 [Acipenser sinensis]
MGRKSCRKQRKQQQQQQQQLQHPSCMPGWKKDSLEQELEDDEDWKSFVRSLAAELCPGCGAYGHTLAICPTQYEEEEELAPRRGEHERPAPRRGEHERPAPRRGEHERPAPRRGEHERPAPRRGEHERPAPRRGEHERPAPRRGEHERPAPRRGEHERPAPERLLSPPPWEDMHPPRRTTFLSSEGIWDWLEESERDFEEAFPMVINLLRARDGERWKAWEQQHHPASLPDIAAMVLRYLAEDINRVPPFPGPQKGEASLQSPAPGWEEPERPTPEWEEPERPTPEWEEPECPTPEWEELECPTPE